MRPAGKGQHRSPPLPDITAPKLDLPFSGSKKEHIAASDLQCWLLTDGKIGDEVPIRGVAEAMGFVSTLKTVRPSPFFAALAPWGPVDRRDCRAVLRPPSPSIAFAAGRRAVPYLRALKRASPTTFAVFFGDPRTRRHGADVVWAPEHDGLAGPDVIVTTTTPHTRSPTALAQARCEPHPAIAALPQPFVGLLLGGPSRHHRFAATNIAALVGIAQQIRAQGLGVAVTGSRRTPPALIALLRDRFAGDPGAVVWTGEGDSPYVSILALADALVVTADSTNMVGEALAAGVPVHLYEPSGGHPKLAVFRDGLLAAGAVRRWTGRIEYWPTAPIDSTPIIAAEIAKRFAAFQQADSRA